jgi:hypothetical protein
MTAQSTEGIWDPRCPAEDPPNVTVHLPHESDCGLFYKCGNGYRYLIPCPPGLHWSIIHDRCEWPYLALCDPAQLPPLPEGTTTATAGTTTVTVGTTTFTAGTTTPMPSACPAIDNPNELVFVSDGGDCGSYSLCFNGRKIDRRCSDGLLWDDNRNWCDFSDNVRC